MKKKPLSKVSPVQYSPRRQSRWVLADHGGKDYQTMVEKGHPLCHTLFDRLLWRLLINSNAFRHQISSEFSAFAHGLHHGKLHSARGWEDQLVQTWCRMFCEISVQFNCLAALAILAQTVGYILNLSNPVDSISCWSYCLLQCQSGLRFDII